MKELGYWVGGGRACKQRKGFRSTQRSWPFASQGWRLPWKQAYVLFLDSVLVLFLDSVLAAVG